MPVINDIDRIYVTIATEDRNLSESDPLEIIEIDNLGASEATRITERGPMQDGDTDTDQVLEPRIIPITLQARITPTYSQRYIRDLINGLFKGTNVPILLTLIFGDGTTYRIDTKSVGGIRMPLNITSTNYIRAGINLRAGNPTFYNPNASIFNFGLSGAGETLVPTTVPTFVGGSALDQTTPIDYIGTYRAYPIITLTGPLTNPKIENTTMGTKIDFTGFTIANGDYYTIDLRFGRKIVYKNGNTADNRINEVSLDSNLSTFCIEASPVAPSGVNTIHVTASGITGVSAIIMNYNDRFDGI